MIKTSATQKIFTLRKRIRIVSGGTSASKTISILLWMIQRAQQNQNEMLSVVSETFPHLKRGAMRDFLNIMEEHHYFNDAQWNKTDCIYTFHTGSKIEFFSADQPGKVRGPRRDILFINEANNISYEVYTQLEVRTKKIIWIDYNPVSEFWVYTDVIPHQEHDFLTLTYKDNEGLDEAIIKAIESRRHMKNWWTVYGMGQLGEAEGRIYTGWILLDDIPEEARLKRQGLDFGYTNDPTALVEIYEYNGGYLLDEVLYRKGMTNKDIADVMLSRESVLCYADSAEPKSIDEIASYGVSILPSQKGPGSVMQGIQYVQEQTIYVTKRSINLLKEYRNYLWLTDKDGKIINEPQDFMNHLLDAVRYGLEGVKPMSDITAGAVIQQNRQALNKWAIG